MVKLRLIRQPCNDNATFGVLFVNNFFECFTLERTDRIIPAGTYDLILYQSPRHKRLVPLLQKVPNRGMIEIHIANYPVELEGCIAVGNNFTTKMLMSSTKAFTALMSKIKLDDKLLISIENPL
jgi:hypothetical protein